MLKSLLWVGGAWLVLTTTIGTQPFAPAIPRAFLKTLWAVLP